MLVAGLDIGNATTEVVVASHDPRGVRPLGVAQARTSGRKGSAASLRGARRLLEQLEREAGGRCDLVAVCDLYPVDTLTVPLCGTQESRAGVRQLAGTKSDTPAGCGMARGTHVALALLDMDPDGEAAVVSVPADVDFEAAAARLNEAFSRGWQIVGVLVGGDDAVLIHNRLAFDVPIVDEANVDEVPSRAVVALEVAPEGASLSVLSDPAALAHSLGIAPGELSAVEPGARELQGRRAAAVTAAPSLTVAPGARELGHLAVEDALGARELPLDASLAPALRTLAPGAARALVLPSATGGRRIAIRDAWTADLRAVDHAGWLRRGVARLDQAPLAALIAAEAPQRAALAAELGRPVLRVGVEARAAACGARTTPGAPADALVLDIGGGTIDLAAASATVSVAGAGELLTAVVATALDLPRGLAERVKRGPAVHVATPHLTHHEDGSRSFLTPPADGQAVGQLALADEHSALTPFARGVAPEEWRALRHALKEQVIGANVERCLRAAKARPTTLLVAGGGGLDHDVVAMIGERLRGDGWVVARADVAGRFGPRFAVAWGAVLAATEEAARVVA